MGGSDFFGFHFDKIIVGGGSSMEGGLYLHVEEGQSRIPFFWSAQIFHIPRPSTSFNSKLGQKLAMDWMGGQQI